ncbi:hypothetical protein AQPE_2012 [Aquipluma nitroreducens]|uniref:Co-chaperone DjlA N-terminal domain-containing protein n=1 Tax=Aquipluma nitroreducens TaxID=2010828 RepID=A0A5K7S8G9_9BACT|nr:hypothetical protein [Aquipluma nitroreducens]BBE17853.1 hypothetical protein AQPE_2012 [Aquipluma nitroreducens]
MFKLFKKKEPNPISNEWSNLTINQRMSVLNLIFSISIGDNGLEDSNKRVSILNTYIGLLGVRSDQCMAYFTSEGYTKMVSDLIPLSQKQKEFLIIAAYEMITRNGKAKDTELIMTGNIFEQIGIDAERFMATIEKAVALTNYFSKV